MSQDEVTAIMKAKYESTKISWEQTRNICFYNIISMNGTKHYKRPQDLFPLPWDNDDTPKGKRLEKDEFMNIANKIRNGK